MLFVAGKYTSAFLWLFALLRLAWGRGIANTSTIESVPKLSCVVPPQIPNGEWKLHASLCGGEVDCDVSQGSNLEPGSQLVYRCTPGYKIEGSTHVFCEQGGNWSPLPVCIEIKCSALMASSQSTKATCTTQSGDQINCDSSVPPGTRINASCHLGYREESNRTEAICGPKGIWEPNTIACIPAVCGDVLSPQTPSVINGNQANNFPWHASVYLQTNTAEGSEKVFKCGATIVRDNLLLTAAHCIDDIRTGTTVNPRRLFVMVGNVISDYDSPLHDPATVGKGMVKNVYRDCPVRGLSGIPSFALLELQEPFSLSKVILPACLDLEKIAVAFNTTNNPRAPLACGQCQASEVSQYGVFTRTDEFCAQYTNGSAVCDASPGGGLVIEQDDLWQILGFTGGDFGVNLEDGAKRCDTYPYSLHIRLSNYILQYN